MRRDRTFLVALSLVAAAVLVGTTGPAGAADGGNGRGDGNGTSSRKAASAAQHRGPAVDTGWRGASVDSRWQDLTTVRSSRPILLTLTDSYCEGDVLAVRDNGVRLGTTSAVDVMRCGNKDDLDKPWPSLASDKYSHGTFLLKAGRTHHLEIRLSVNPFGGAGIFLRMDSPGAVWGRIHRTLAHQ